MAIRALSMRECDRFNAARSIVRRHTDQAVEWFADDDDTVIGAIAYHPLELAWSVLVLERDQRGAFRPGYPGHRHAGLFELEAAQRLLVEQMARSLAAEPYVSSPHQPAA